MATRLIGTDDANPRLPALVVAATQGTTAADLAPGDIGQRVTWSSPIAVGITVGSGTTTASYARIGKVVVATFRFVLGAGSAITGDIQLAVPVTAAITAGIQGGGLFEDVSTATRYAIGLSGSTTNVALRPLNASATYATTPVASATIPFTWTTGDIIVAGLTYLAA